MGFKADLKLLSDSITSHKKSLPKNNISKENPLMSKLTTFNSPLASKRDLTQALFNREQVRIYKSIREVKPLVDTF